MSTIVKDSTLRLKDGQSLTESNMVECMHAIMNGEVEEDALEQFLIALSEKGENVAEITGAAKVMREKAATIKAPHNAVDCCGTGGDQRGTYNVSTAVAIVAAACGVPIAKHGNRAASSKSGAADVLEALGARIDLPHFALEKALREYRFAFLMATNHHQSMYHVAAVRKKIQQRTIFNLLGPLANPGGARYQLLGVFDKKWLMPVAETLCKLGTKRAWIVHSRDGLDEISISDKTDIVMIGEDQKLSERTISPEDFGLPTHNIREIIGGDVAYNAKALRAVLEGEKSAYRNIVLANTAAVLCIHNNSDDLKNAVSIAAEAIDSGFAWQNFCDYITFTRGIEDDIKLALDGTEKPR
jgi:anthranilate phosphoribosyltransferase